MDRQRSHDNRPQARFLAERAFSTLQRFFNIEAVSGIALLITATVALMWASSPFAGSYPAAWHFPLWIGAGELVFHLTTLLDQGWSHYGGSALAQRSPMGGQP